MEEHSINKEFEFETAIENQEMKGFVWRFDNFNSFTISLQKTILHMCSSYLILPFKTKSTTNVANDDKFYTKGVS